MSRKAGLIILLLTSMMINAVMAQTSQVLYFMNVPQRNTFNPALQSSGRVFVGLGISDVALSFDNNFISFSDIYRDNIISDSTVTFLEPCDELNAFLAGLKNKNSVEPQAGVQLFGLAFTLGNGLRITFDINERADGNFVLPEDLIRLGIEGNEKYIGKTLGLSSVRSDVRYYHETGIGASGNVTDKLRLGARLLILSGVASAYFDNNHLSLTVNDDHTQTVSADVALRVSAPVSFYKDQEGIIDSVALDEGRFDDAGSVFSYMAGTGNTGLGLELGAEYRFNQMFAVSASLTDLGYIKWKRDRSDLFIDTSFELNGLTMQDVYDESVTFGELMNWTLDSIQNSLNLNETPPPYTTYLPPCLTAGFSYTPVSYFTLGALSQTRFRGTQVHESFTVSGNFNVNNIFSGTIAYTIANQRFDNLGLGFAVRGGFFQFYTLVDNIPLVWSKVRSGENTFWLPENWYTMHARMGVNFVFGNKEKKEPLPANF